MTDNKELREEIREKLYVLLSLGGGIGGNSIVSVFSDLGYDKRDTQIVCQIGLENGTLAVDKNLRLVRTDTTI